MIYTAAYKVCVRVVVVEWEAVGRTVELRISLSMHRTRASYSKMPSI